VRLKAACVFAEPQFDPRLAGTLAEGTGARTGILDPLGAALAPGADLYPGMMENLADAVSGCLK
jgi:zinc transport system substrate-binding protein